MSVTGSKSARKKAEETLRLMGAEPDDGLGEAAPPGSD